MTGCLPSPKKLGPLPLLKPASNFYISLSRASAWKDISTLLPKNILPNLSRHQTSMAYFLAILALLVHFASANFDLYRIHGQRDIPGSPWGTQPNGFMVFNDDPQCSDITGESFWWERPDVSGDKLGVRCEGKCGVDDVSNTFTKLYPNITARESNGTDVDASGRGLKFPLSRCISATNLSTTSVCVHASNVSTSRL